MPNHMINTPKHIARLAGFWYLTLIPLGFFGVLYVPSLVAPGDMASTMSNIAASESLFRLSVVSTFIMNIVSIVIVLLLYKLFKPVNKNLGRYMVAWLLIGVAISMLNEVNHFAALILSGADTVAVFTAEQSQYLARLFLDLHKYGINIAAIFWGLWLFPLGYLIIKSNFLPKILGILLIIAGVGYLIDSFALFLIPHYEITVTDFTSIGEILFLLWLLVKGVDVEQWKKRTLEFEGV